MALVKEKYRMHLVLLDFAEHQTAWEMKELQAAHKVTLILAVRKDRMHPELPGFALHQKE